MFNDDKAENQVDQRYCFLHIPKTAGTMLMAFLDDHFDLSEIHTDRNSVVLDSTPLEELSKYRLFRGHFNYESFLRIPVRPHFLTMLRDPVTRVISFYNHERRVDVGSLPNIPGFPIIKERAARIHEMAMSCCLEEFVTDEETQFAVSNAQVYQFAARSDGPRRPEDLATYVRQAKERLEEFLFVGLVERFDEAMRMLAHDMGWLAPYSLQPLNQASQVSAVECYPQSTIDAIIAWNQGDIELYEFAKDLFSRRYEELLQKDLEANYLRAWERRHRQRHRYLKVNFENAIEGLGWHQRESHMDEQLRARYPAIWRWTGPMKESFLDLPLVKDEDLLVKVRVIDSMAPDILQSLTMAVNGESIEIEAISDGGQGIVYAGLVRKGQLNHGAGPVRLSLRVNRTLPLNADLGDGRLCGVAITEVVVRPGGRVSSDTGRKSDELSGPLPQTEEAHGMNVSHRAQWLGDSYWCATADFLMQAKVDARRLVAPREFAQAFPGIMAYDSISPVSIENSDWVVVHKGMTTQINTIFLDRMVGLMKPVFANEVFVVYSRFHEDVNLHGSPHVYALQEILESLDRPRPANFPIRTPQLRVAKGIGLMKALKRIWPHTWGYTHAAHSKQCPIGQTFNSVTCREEHFDLELYRFWCRQFRETPRFHRKQWEFVFISQTLYELGCLCPGKRGLGFGVGCEPLSAVFAGFGCEILATDMAAADAEAAGWTNTNQHAQILEDLNDRGICPPEVFARNVRFEIVDMNIVPSHLTDFDFCWSACALEHLGSIRKGVTFIRRSLDCLRRGGVAVHTTEFNVSSNWRTIDNAGTVLFRRRDLEALVDRLERDGYKVAPLDLAYGQGPLDNYIDAPPYRSDRHLKLFLSGFVTTSAGIIIEKPE